MASLYKVFVGCPFAKTTYGMYERLKTEVEAETPLKIVLADTAELTSTNDLLKHVTDLIRDSAACIFDITGGNPNVALEVGIAHAIPIDFLITMKSRKPRKVSGKTGQSPASPIIADLRGRVGLKYTTYATLKDQLYSSYFSRLTLFERWCEFKKQKSTFVPGALKVFEGMRVTGRLKGPEIDRILAKLGLKPRDLVPYLKEAELVLVRRGRNGGYFYPTS